MEITSQPMDKKSQKINQLSRLLFDKASDLFYGSMFAELVLGLVIACVSPKLTTTTQQYILSGTALFFLLIIYFVKKHSETLHGDAETMRRQSVFSQSLGWGLDTISYQFWKDKAGDKLVTKLENNPLPDGYYATTQKDPAKKLLEMTNESSFWSMHFNRKAKELFIALLVVFILIMLFVLFALPYFSDPEYPAQIIVLFITALLSLDAFGLVNRLHTNQEDLKKIYSKTTEIIVKKGLKKDEPLAIRWASEYNCLMANRVPMFRFFYDWWHDEIQHKWDTRND